MKSFKTYLQESLTNKCQLCKKEKGLHKAKTLNCPVGSKTRIGYTSYHPTQVFTQKISEAKMAKGTYAELGMSEKSRQRIFEWLENYGIENLSDPETYHCTVVFSGKKHIPELNSYNPPLPILAEVKGWHIFPTQTGTNCLVLDVDNEEIQALHKYAEDLGATWDFPEYHPHVTVSTDYQHEEVPEEFPPVKITFVNFNVEDLD